MKRLIGILLALFLVAPVSAQSPQIRQLLLKQLPSGAVAGYQGIGDVTSGAAIYFGTRGYNAAYSGKAIEVCLPADTACNDATISSGNLVLNAAQSTCNNSTVICTARTIYDQIGTGCTGSPCDVQQAGTPANRFTLVFNAVGTWTCLAVTSSSAYNLSANALTTIAQPFTYVFTGERTAGFTSTQGAFGDTTSGGSIGFNNAANQAGLYAGGGSAVGFAATDSTFHAIQALATGASSILNVDASSSGALNPGSSSFAGNVHIGVDNFANKLQGMFCEAAIYAGDKSSGFSARSSNIHTYGGF